MIILCDMIDSEKELSKFRRFYETYKNTMYSVSYDITKHEQDAEDIVAESMIKVISILHKIDKESIGKTKCKNLAITIAKNTAIDYVRKKEHEPIPVETVEFYQNDKSTEELYIDMENYQELIECIGSLEDKYKDVLRLKILYRFSSKEIAVILNITEANVNMRFSRAKKILRERMEEQGKHESGFGKEKK